MPTYTSRGLRFSYDVVGSGRPLVMLHGLTNFGLVWAPQLGLLTSLGWQLLLPDLAGHGQSDPVTAPTTTQDLASDVVALLDHLSLDRAVVCGLSLGGMVAQQLLVDAPERFDAAVVASTGAHLTFPEAKALIASWTAMWLAESGPLRRLEATWPVLTTEPYRRSPDGQAFYEAWRQVLRGVSGQSLAHVAAGLLEFDVTAQLPGVGVPVLALAGEHDRLAPPTMVHAVADLVPRARFATVAAAGHLTNLEQPASFNALLRDFLGGLPR